MRFLPALLLIAATLSASANADYMDVLFPPLAGFTHAVSSSRDSSAGHGVILSSSAIGNSAPAIAELDGNSANGKEVVVASSDGTLSALSSAGTILWTAKTPNSNCGGSGNRILSSPAVGELFGDGMPYVVIGYGGIVQKGCDGGVSAYRGIDGSLLWNFSVTKWGKRKKLHERFSSVFSTPALSDTDHDGKMEIAFGSFDRHVYLLNANGSVRWYYQAADTAWSSPAFADLNSDGIEEVVFATDISKNTKINPPTPNGGYLYAMPSKSLKGKEIRFRTKYMWITAMDQTPFSSPVVADVLPANPGYEVIMGSGYYFSNSKGRSIKIYSGKTGKLLKSLSISTPTATSVAVADLNGDGLLEVIASVSGATQYGGDGRGEVLAWTPALSAAPMWSVEPSDRGAGASFQFASPVVADIDGNGSQEVLISTGRSVVVLEGESGRQLTCEDSECSASHALYTFAGLSSTPAVGDINSDGFPDVVAAGASSLFSGKGVVYAWTDFSTLGSAVGAMSPFTADWPQARAAAARAGRK